MGGVFVLCQQLGHLGQGVFECGRQGIGRVDQEHAAGRQAGAFGVARDGFRDLARLDGERGVQPALARLGGQCLQAAGQVVGFGARDDGVPERIGARGKTLERMLKQVNRVIVPVQPSFFDILATRHFLETLLDEKAVRKAQVFVAVVGMRVDVRTRAAGELERFLAAYDLPILTYLRDTQTYVQLAANGMTLFDLSASRAEKDMGQWQPILDWVDA